MNNLDNKEYYTYAEIIKALRTAYQQSETILNQMKENIRVQTDEKHDANLHLHLKNNRRDQLITLHVAKDLNSSIGVRVRATLNKYYYDAARADLDNASFSLIDDDGHLYFEQFDDYIHFYQPKVVILNQEDFKNKYEELKRIPLYSIPEIFERINPFQNICIWGDYLDLTSEGEAGKGIAISYNPKDDKIHIDSSKRYSTYFIETLLATRIPKYLLPNEFIQFMDSNNDQLDDAFVHDIIGKRKEILSIKEEPKRLILNRQKKS